MHISGKILVWLLLILWGVALYFSTGVVKIRSAWLEKLQKTEKQIAELTKEIAELRDTRSIRESELTRELAPWGAYWNGVKANALNQQTGQFQIGMTDATGTPVKLVENQIVHAFAPGPDGKGSAYLGSFKVQQVQPQAATLAPAFSLRLQDPLARPDLAEALNLAKADPKRVANFDSLAGWNAQAVRIRSDVPSAYTGNCLQIEMELLRADERVIAAAAAYNGQLTLEADAKKLIAQHTEAIVGGMPQKEVPAEFNVGYLKAIEDEASARDAALFAVDELRHQVKSATDEFFKLRVEIQQMEKGLPRTVTPAQTARR